MIISAMMGYYFRYTATDDLRAYVEKGNVSLIHAYVNTVWRKHAPLFKRLEWIQMDEWYKDHEFISFSRETFKFFENIPIGRTAIYTRSGGKFISIDQSEIKIYQPGTTESGFTSGAGLRSAQGGEVYSRIIEDGYFKAPDGSTRQGAMVQTIIPILAQDYVPVIAGTDKDSKVEAIIEIYYDITPQWDRLYLFQYLGTAGILLVFVCLIGALYFTSIKAESIIARKHEENVELASAKAQAEAASRDKSQFLANISHELRTPLNAIIGFSEMMKNEIFGAISNKHYVDYIKDIHNSGEHLLSLINDILDFSKAEAGKLDIELTTTDVTRVLKSCIRAVTPRAERAGIELKESYPEERLVIQSDAKRLKQIILNLLSNAVKFTNQGGEVRLTTMYGLDGKSIMIVVKDTGIGMAKKDIAKALAVFGQVDSELSRKYEGTGLGLPLTKKLVSLLGGTFEIESEPDVGTQITLRFPINGQS